MENITIQNINYKDYHFTYAEYFGYKILINKDDGYINITKLLNIINEEHKKNNKPLKNFYHLITTEDFKELLNELSSLSENGEATKKSIFYYNLNGVINEFKGTYIHKKLLNYVLLWADKTYYIFVSEIMDKLNNNQFEEIKRIKEDYETENQKLKSENQKLKLEIEESKPRLIPEQTNELETNQIIRVYKIDDNNYKLSYNQNKKLKYELIGEFIFNCASNISKSEGLKQFYSNNSKRTFNRDKLKEVLKYLNIASNI